MEPIKFKTWLTWALILFALGVLADYYFLHILFHEKPVNSPNAMVSATNGTISSPETAGTPTAPSLPSVESESEPDSTPRKDNFLENLKKCAPEIAAQAVATPEALMEYLKKSVGIKSEDITIENYHITLNDGSQRRIHVVASDNTNSPNKKELRFFKLDAEGYPERLPLKPEETLQSLLALGTLQHREVKSQLNLKDDTSVSLETHDNKVYEFQYTNHNHVLSCRLKECQCP
ncbi:MAG: hypothetical protein ACKOX6_06065 [Bdellovibrio sp.]